MIGTIIQVMLLCLHFQSLYCSVEVGRIMKAIFSVARIRKGFASLVGLIPLLRTIFQVVA